MPNENGVKRFTVPDGIERRTFQVRELRAKGGGDKPTVIYGHAALFNSPADSGWGWSEQVAPGAFAHAIQTDDVRALFNHNPDCVLGRNKSKTLALQEDQEGLYFEVEAPSTTWAADLVTSMQRGDINQMSFGFSARKAEWDYSVDPPLRTLIEVTLYDVSVVTFPFYGDTEAQVRSILTAAAGVDEAHLGRFLERAEKALGEKGLNDGVLKRYLEGAGREVRTVPEDDGLWQLDLLERQLRLIKDR